MLQRRIYVKTAEQNVCQKCIKSTTLL